MVCRTDDGAVGNAGAASVRWWRDHKYSEHNERTLASMVEARYGPRINKGKRGLYWTPVSQRDSSLATLNHAAVSLDQ